MTGDNGILEQAANAKEQSDQATITESVTLAVNGAIMASDSFIVEESLLNNELANYFNSYSVSGDSESGFTITVNSKRYIVTSLGSITQIADDWYGDGTASEFYISEASQLCEFSDIVNSGISFKNKTIYLTNDLDMTDYTLTPVALYGSEDWYCFSGTFNGQGYSICNLDSPVDNDGKSYLFGHLDGGSIIGLGIEDSSIISSGSAATFGTFLEGASIISDCWCSNCYIEGSSAARNCFKCRLWINDTKLL